jgi:predicted phosphodiesterase
LKIGVFSDIHGNLFAFENIYKELKKEACDMHLFLGDVCGYYFQQNEVLDILSSIPNLHAVQGNHDRMFLGALEDEKEMELYTKHFGLSFENLKETISPKNLAFLKSLGEECYLEECGAAGFHGSPWKPTGEYVYPDSSEEQLEQFDSLPQQVVFLGHTHWVMDIEREHTRIINPGSAGQPRDGGWPSFGVYDTASGELKIKRVTYNVNTLINDIKQRMDPNTYLIDVLKRIKQ